MSPEVTIAVIQIVSVTAIGVFTARIARQQRQIRQQQLEIDKYRVKLDLYDRRWEVYERFAHYVGVATRDLNLRRSKPDDTGHLGIQTGDATGGVPIRRRH